MLEAVCSFETIVELVMDDMALHASQNFSLSPLRQLQFKKLDYITAFPSLPEIIHFLPRIFCMFSEGTFTPIIISQDETSFTVGISHKLCS
jgi:hypothetical protein